MHKLAPLFALVLLGCPSRPPVASSSPPLRECETDENCEPAAPKCLHVNRKGDFSLADEPLYSMCVAACNGSSCAAGQRCVERRMLKLAPAPAGGQFQQMGVPATEHYCVPLTRYGAAQLGESCARDEDCAADAPYCAGGHCTRLCTSNCPGDFVCRAFQRVTREAVQSFNFCLKSP